MTNLSARTQWQDLKQFVRRVAEVNFADCHRSREGEGVVEFASRRDMEGALSRLEGTELDGNRIHFSPARVRCVVRFLNLSLESVVGTHSI